ncbi:PadR family transcriptional regulator [Sphaerisporangium sp. NPDC051011]|uniref:PadR family transcriptional regulator n=1 Tax=Sphaerisporangium sp. NPDC051011 TaxID=3155792 RepID=UPI0033E7D8F1
MSLRVALLGLLTYAGPASGYDLTKAFERSINYVWQAGHSQIYPELAKMAADGLITVEAQGTRGRKTYTITREGSDELRRWLTEHTPSGPVRSERALQAFLLPLLEPSDALTVLRRVEADATARLRELEELFASERDLGAEPGNVGDFALDLGIKNTRTTVAWARAAAETIEATTRTACDGGTDAPSGE